VSIVQRIEATPTAVELPPTAVIVEEVKHSEQQVQPKDSSADMLLELEDSSYQWIIEITAVTNQSDYERFMVQLQKDGFHPIVRVENKPNKSKIFRIEIHESEINSALVKMSQLKRLKYLDPKRLVMKPANTSDKKN